jgi:hypothetical protein
VRELRVVEFDPQPGLAEHQAHPEVDEQRREAEPA